MHNQYLQIIFIKRLLINVVTLYLATSALFFSLTSCFCIPGCSIRVFYLLHSAQEVFKLHSSIFKVNEKSYYTVCDNCLHLCLDACWEIQTSCFFTLFLQQNLALYASLISLAIKPHKYQCVPSQVKISMYIGQGLWCRGCDILCNN